MKTKRILFIAITVILIVTLAIVAFVACDGNSGDGHQHTFSQDWTSDETYHWHPATCEHTDEMGDKAEHTFGSDGKCSVCNSYGTQGVVYGNYGLVSAVIGFGDSMPSDIVILDYYQGYPVTYIRDEVFKDCSKLKTVSFTDKSQLQSIRYSAFDGCSSLTEITIPSTVTKIDYYAFRGCSSLQTVYYGGTFSDWCNMDFYHVDSNPMEYASDFYMLQDGSWQKVTEITIPEDVEDTAQIGEQIKNFNSVTSIIIPSTITNISYGAFAYCTNLQTVMFEGDSQLQSIGESAFKGCSSLTEITIPSNVTNISNSTFEGCTNLQTVTFEGDSQLQSIGESAFEGCSSLTEITIPSTVTMIDIHAFMGCSSLEEITVPNSVTNIEVGAFSSCSSLQKITLPFVGESSSEMSEFGYIFTSNQYVPTSLKSVVIMGGVIGKSAFDGCNSITDITIQSDVTSVGKSAFSNMQNLHIVKWNATNCTVEGQNGIFNGSCNKFNSARWNGMTVTIGENVEYINDYTFYGADIGTLVFVQGGSLKEIGSYAFAGCHTLQEIRNLPNNVDIAEDAFDNSTMLTTKLSSYNPGNLFSWNDFVFYKDGGSYVLVDYVSSLVDALLQLPDGVYQYGVKLADTYRVGDQAFIYRKDLIIAVPACAIDPPSEAFTGCTGRVVYLSRDESIWEQDGIVYRIDADNSAFIVGAYCTGSVTIPDWIESLSISSSKENIILDPTAVTIPNSVTSIGDSVFRDCTNLQTITFKRGSQLQSIGNEAFCKCSSLTEITIPSAVASIGKEAFYECVNLQTVTFERGSQLPSIGESAFYHCSSLTEITIPASVTSIGGGAFNSTNLQIVTFERGSKLQSIGNGAFWNCNDLTEITIPSTVTSIGSYAFRVCTNLQTVTLDSDSQLQSIGSYAFNDCSSLEEITIPSTVTSIGQSAFQDCDSLQTVTFDRDSQLQSVGKQAFWNCNDLTEITIPSTVTSIGCLAFSGCSSLQKVTFENPDGWKANDTDLTLTDTAQNAQYLRETYKSYIWTRS